MRPGAWRAVKQQVSDRGRSATSAPGDDGLSLVELLVAVLILVIILLPTTIFVIQGERTVSEQHVRSEAINLATATLERLQLDAANGQLPTGTATSTASVNETGSRSTIFTVRTSWRAVVQGTNQSICATSANVAQQIWLVTAKVTWRGMNGMAPVDQATEIAPAQAGAIQQSAGELAVRLSVDGTTTNLFTGGATATVTGIWNGTGSGPPVPPGEVTTETATSGNDGCIVFQNLDADSNTNGSFVYRLSFADNATLVSGDEHADGNPNGPLVLGNISLQPGVPYVDTVLIDTGTVLTIDYTSPGGSCTVPARLPASPPVTSSVIPVSVQNSFLTTYVNSTWVAYGTTPFNSLLVYPWAGVTTLWAGDQPASAPSSYLGGPRTCVVDASSGSPTVYLPVYPLDLTITGSPRALSAVETAGAGYSFALELAPGKSATSLPLGEYLLSDAGGRVTIGGTRAYVWVTPTGECVDAVVASVPPATCSSATLAVTAS